MSPVTQTHAAALYVSLLRDRELELAQDFMRWWLERTGEELQPRGFVGVDPSWDADELGIDEDDQWP